jgi:hypothetical protein
VTTLKTLLRCEEPTMGERTGSTNSNRKLETGSHAQAGESPDLPLDNKEPTQCQRTEITSTDISGRRSMRKLTPGHCAVSRRKIAVSSRPGWTWEHEEPRRPNQTETTYLAVTKSKRGITTRTHKVQNPIFSIEINTITIDPRKSSPFLTHLIGN